MTLSLGLAAAISSAQAPSQAPSSTPAPSPVPVVEEPRYDSYLDAPQTPGTWVYEDEPGEKLAVYIHPETGPLFVMRCATGSFGLARLDSDPSQGARAMSISTETVTRQLQVSPLPERHLLAVDIDPRDPLLDAMAITKGRFAVEVEGESTLYLPAWTEVSRVIEDCR